MLVRQHLALKNDLQTSFATYFKRGRILFFSRYETIKVLNILSYSCRKLLLALWKSLTTLKGLRSSDPFYIFQTQSFSFPENFLISSHEIASFFFIGLFIFFIHFYFIFETLFFVLFSFFTSPNPFRILFLDSLQA